MALTADRVRHLFHYNPDTGVFIRFLTKEEAVVAREAAVTQIQGELSSL